MWPFRPKHTDVSVLLDLAEGYEIGTILLHENDRVNAIPPVPRQKTRLPRNELIPRIPTLFWSGLIWGCFAFLLWGSSPLFIFDLSNNGMSIGEIVSARILCTLPVFLLWILATGRISDLARTMRNRKYVVALSVSSLLQISSSILITYSIINGRLTSICLSLYLIPVFSSAVIHSWSGKKISLFFVFSIVFALLGSVTNFWSPGTDAFLPIAFYATSFGYIAARRIATTDMYSAVTIELAFASPFALIFLLWEAFFIGGTHVSYHHYFGLAGLALCSALPTILFALSIRRLPLWAFSIIQNLSPTISMALAISVFGESLTYDNIAIYVFVSAAVVFSSLDAMLMAWQQWYVGKIRAREEMLRSLDPPVDERESESEFRYQTR